MNAFLDEFDALKSTFPCRDILAVLPERLKHRDEANLLACRFFDAMDRDFATSGSP